ncbi:aldo/keto reductase family protein [Effusibacillus consociatus]|uniref:Aldo/keto reductase family protein n=1 Tax=Effusibacillus consociatus TaxID=1117041 RepID=A0ABV9Q592_9BACL
MKYRKLGNSGLRVSEIALGSWLTYGSSVEKDMAIRCIDKAYELGINFFDTANVYARGESEKVVGEALRKYPRESYVLATKVFFPMGEGPNDKGLSRKHIIEQCNASLKRLGVEYIDLYQCHRYDPETPLDETLRALDDLVTQGKVLYVGVSEWNAVQINDALHLADKNGYDRILSNQPVYNMLNRYIEESVLPLCEREGVGQVVFSPLAQGLLTGKYKPGQPIPEDSRAANPQQNMFIKRYMTEKVLQQVEQLDKIAKEAGMPLSNLALAWILRQPGISSAIIGASRPEQIEENIKASTIHLSPELIESTDAVLGW